MNTATKTETATKNPRNLNRAQTVEAFRKFIAARAMAEGININGLQISDATLEATWGDLSGYVFHGCADEINARVAASFLAFAGKYMKSGSYEAQHALRPAGVRFFHEYTNGASAWSKSDEASKFVALKNPIVKGHAIATTYYPCAD